MTRLEDIYEGCYLLGIDASGPVLVRAILDKTENSLEIVCKDLEGKTLPPRLLYRTDEAKISIVEKPCWQFDGDADEMRLMSEAYRIHLAHLFDPYLAVHTSSVEPLPHQISAVYQEMLPRLPLRYILADDPGAGKTIMTGLLLKELIVRGDLKRCLIVSPGSLSEQWQDELAQKFHLGFEILTNDNIEAALGGNVFLTKNYLIARLDKLARNEDLQAKLRLSHWDLIVVDEAHKMSATVWGGEVKYTHRFRLGQMLSGITNHFLLLTATPHNGKPEDFQLFMSLVDPDRFEGANHNKPKAIEDVDVSDVMRRLVKEELLKFDGTPLFPERIADTVNYTLSQDEKILYDAVSNYVRTEFNRADNLDDKRKSSVGFALTILQRRLASSPEAIYQSLKRRRERLDKTIQEWKMYGGPRQQPQDFDIYDDEDDLTADELERTQDEVLNQASAAKTIEEMERELLSLKALEKIANNVRNSGTDCKWRELSRLLQDDENMVRNGKREKIIIFTEHRDTLNYLQKKIVDLLGGNEEAVVTIYGGLSREKRRQVESDFRSRPEVCVMIATDAAGEGINLQRAHLMINYDLPWNPNRLEQRFGRIHRIGQTEVCFLWNLVAKETREGDVFERLFTKLEEEREALGGKVFDILGKVSFDNKPLRDLLIEAIRYGNKPEVREKLYKVVDTALDRKKLQDLLDERALTEDSMDMSQVMRIRENMERMEARKFQPYFIESFFNAAFKDLGGRCSPREKNRYELKFVPKCVRDSDLLKSSSQVVSDNYERICFDKRYKDVSGKPPAQLIYPGHPLLDSIIDEISKRHLPVLKRGTIFVNDNDFDSDAKVLFYIESNIQNGKHETIAQDIHFVELKQDKTAENAGYAPYLDYRKPNDDEQSAIRAYLESQSWLKGDLETFATSYAKESILPAHLEELRERKVRMIEKTMNAVTERLDAEIRYWDARAWELSDKESKGKVNDKLNSRNAAQRAEELTERKAKRLAELEQEKLINAMPPRIIGGALVIPKGLLNKLMPTTTPEPEPYGGMDKKAVEMAGMKAVMDIERELGFLPRDVSADKCGYDVESLVPEDKRTSNSSLRFIEVKGRQKGADQVTVTKNEILTSLNQDERGNFILALVEVDGDTTHTTYLRNAFKETPDFAAVSITFNIEDLKKQAEIILER